jgi:fructoselysine-6-P-deglycase FrlB-like protein
MFNFDADRYLAIQAGAVRVAQDLALISPVILACVLERVDAYLEHIRQHPLTTRRYYNKVGY